MVSKCCLPNSGIHVFVALHLHSAKPADQVNCLNAFPSQPSTSFVGSMDELLPVRESKYPHRVSKISAHFPQGDLPEPGDSLVQHNGLSEILEVVAILTAAGIPCCAVDNCALNYYGAKRIQSEWILCVPTKDLGRAKDSFLERNFYQVFPPYHQPVDSLVPIYPRLKRNAVDFKFQLHPSYLYLIDCIPDNIEYSAKGVPYPRLAHFAQSLLETNELSSLGDLIDGMNLTEEWGVENLNLKGTTDMEWAKWKIEELVKDGAQRELIFIEYLEPSPTAEIWHRLVRRKEKRCGIKYPLEIYETRFRKRNAPDPRTLDRDM